MSNNLGQIYATSKSANKYIVLESENVEVSGNFYVENNVDICGNLILKGSLGVLDSSTNDISYGNVGSVLTSNGFGNTPTWTAPYYFRVYKNTDQTLTDISVTKVIGFIHDTNASTSQGITDFNTTTDVWSPSIAGVYYVVAQLQIVGGTSQTSGDLLRARVRLMDNATSTTIRYANYWSDYDDQGIYQMSVSFNDLLYTDGSTSYYLDAYVDRIGTGTSKISGQANGYSTWWSAYKIG